MKKQNIKIGSKIFHNILSLKKIIVLLIIVFIIFSCKKDAYYGHDGRPGDAYISLTWEVSQPDYLNAGTGAIPPVFQWGRFYKAYPGYYSLYYEGSVWNGSYWSYYAWEVNYEIWITKGENGGWYYDGADGPDTYFTLQCSPYGPYIYNEYKSLCLNSKYDLLEDTGEIITVIRESEGHSIKITYKKLETDKAKHKEKNTLQ